MRANRRGFSLLELIFAMGLGLTVMAVGYRLYAAVVKMDDKESRRESVMLNLQNAMGRIKGDVRTARSVAGSGGSLVITRDGQRIIYRNASDGSGLERTGRGRSVYKGIAAEFSSADGGVNVKLKGLNAAERGTARFEMACFVRPRNR